MKLGRIELDDGWTGVLLVVIVIMMAIGMILTMIIVEEILVLKEETARLKLCLSHPEVEACQEVLNSNQ